MNINNTRCCLNCGKILLKSQKNFCSRNCMYTSIIYRDKLNASGKKKIFSEEHRKHIGQTKIGNKNCYGRVVSEEQKQKLREINTGKHPSEESKEKNRQAHLGKKSSEETKQRISMSNMGRIVHDETRKKISVSKIGKKMSLEAVAHMSAALKGRAGWNKGKEMSVDTRHNMSVSATGRKLSDNAKQKVGDFFRGKKLSNEHKQKIKDSWNDPIVVKARLGHGSKRPNKIETILLNLLNKEFNSEWKYVGNGSFIIGGKCPDFISINSNKIIELFGDYWHRGQNPQERIDYFLQYGYETLVVWEKEVRKDIICVKNKITDFTVGKLLQLTTRILQT